MGAHEIKHNDVPHFAQRPVNINVSMSPAPELALMPANRYDCDI